METDIEVYQLWDWDVLGLTYFINQKYAYSIRHIDMSLGLIMFSDTNQIS